jgi:hypothetical protein
MVKNKGLKKDIQDVTRLEPLLNAAETGTNSKVGKRLKKFVYLASLAGMGLFLHSCMAGYVATEPTYMEVSRPPRPSDNHVWINGDWSWNRQTRVYVQKDGYWDRPDQGRTLVSGHWQTTSRGHAWVPSHYEKQGRKVNSRSRK